MMAKQDKTIGIVGSRNRNNYNDRVLVVHKFFELYKYGDWITSGGCENCADEFAETIAKTSGIPIVIFFPDWKGLGKAAGPIRNKKIAEFSDVLIACWDKQSRGTLSTINYFKNSHKDWENNLYII